MGMIGYAKAGEEVARVFRLLTATVGMLAIFPISVGSADDLKPPVGYRQWFHVNTMIVDKASPLFDVLGGMHKRARQFGGRIRAQEGRAISQRDRVLDRLA